MYEFISHIRYINIFFKLRKKILLNVSSLHPYLNDALEVHIHRVGKLKGLKVGVRNDGGRRAEILDLLELGHDLGPDDAAQLVD